MGEISNPHVDTTTPRARKLNLDLPVDALAFVDATLKRQHYTMQEGAALQKALATLHWALNPAPPTIGRNVIGG
jgi:hypothetical protein